MKTKNFSETIAACDLKDGGCRQLIEKMKVCELQGQCHFLTLAQGHLHIKINTFFLRNHWAIFIQIVYVIFQE